MEPCRVMSHSTESGRLVSHSRESDRLVWGLWSSPELMLWARENGMFPLAGDANVLIFACLPGAIAAVEVSAYGGICG